jgi:SAM-dependent methyltransferase
MKKILKQTWWDNNLNSKMQTFLNWVGDSDSESKVFFRNLLKSFSIKIENCLDVGCGPATEYEGFKKDNIDIKYTGVDSSTVLVELNKSRGVPMIHSPAHNIPVEDNSFDLVFSRHVFEHQPDFKPILEEMIRVSSKLVSHIFFIKPGEYEKIKFTEEENLYHVRFKKIDIENFIKNHAKVKKFEWIDINQKENMLLIWI